MHEFFEESFDLENTFENILSIQVSLNGFSFSVQRSSDGKMLCFKNSQLKISNNRLIARRFKEWFKLEAILQKPFQKIRIIVFSEKFTLVPKNLYSNDLKEELTHIVFKTGSQLKFAENVVEKVNAKLLFALPEGLMQIITEQFGECEIIHPIKLLVNNSCGQSKNNQLLLLFNNNDLFAVLKNGSTVLLANNFTINHTNDVVYFVLTALKQLGVPTKNTELLYAGQSAYSINIEDNLSKHFLSIKRLSPDELKLPEEVIAENISLFL